MAYFDYIKCASKLRATAEGITKLLSYMSNDPRQNTYGVITPGEHIKLL